MDARPDPDHHGRAYRNPTRKGTQKLLDRYAALYGEKKREKLERNWSKLREEGQTWKVEEEKARLLRRMHDISEFAKTLKQRYSISYNRRHDRKGTLWEERFHSIIAEDVPTVLREIAAYIDLNPVRAEMVEAPSSYRWSGIGALSSGDPAPLRGYLSLLGGDRRALEEYMDMVALRAASRLPRLSKARGQALQKVHPYSMSQIRCFTYGTAFGREAFVKKTGTGIAYPAEVEGLCTARPLAGEDGPTRLRAPGRGRG